MPNRHNDNTELATFQVSPFDAIRQVDACGCEYWSARDLQELLGYVKWQKFEDAIERAVISCKNIGQNPEGHFTGAGKLQNRGNRGGTQEVKDYHLTRYACYLTAMNGDPRKPEIASAQAYFVARTQQAEQIQEQLKTQLGSIQFFEQVFKDLLQSISTKEIVENKQLAPYALFMLRNTRLLLYRAVRDYEALIKHYHQKTYKPSIKGDTSQLAIAMHNGEVVVKLQFPFVEEM